MYLLQPLPGSLHLAILYDCRNIRSSSPLWPKGDLWSSMVMNNFELCDQPKCRIESPQSKEELRNTGLVHSLPIVVFLHLRYRASITNSNWSDFFEVVPRHSGGRRAYIHPQTIRVFQRVLCINPLVSIILKLFTKTRVVWVALTQTVDTWSRQESHWDRLGRKGKYDLEENHRSGTCRIVISFILSWNDKK